jgi:hypothetical protein
MDVARFRAEEEQVARIREMVRPLLIGRCDFPYETGVNSRGGKGYSLWVRVPADTDMGQPSEPGERLLFQLSSSDGTYEIVAEGNSWADLHAAVEARARQGDWWARPIGQRQKVYDFVYNRRFAVTHDDEDARDMAIGAADLPQLGPDYLSQWIAAAPDEVLRNGMAMALLSELVGRSEAIEIVTEMAGRAAERDQ